MLITCLRHATAEVLPRAMKDAQRSLIPKGEKQALRVAAFCRCNALTPTMLLSSPLRRAEQTARILENNLPDCPSAQIVDWLALGAQPEQIVDALKELETSQANDVWLVGHEPDFSGLIGYLLNLPAERIVIKKASLTRLTVDFSALSDAQLLWSIPCALMH